MSQKAVCKESGRWRQQNAQSERNKGHTGGHGANGVDDDSQKGFLVLLVQHLSGTVDTRHPAAVPRVAVVPAHHILQPAHLQPKGKGRVIIK